MAHNVVKTEMTGTGGGRWCPRAEAKMGSKKVRRQHDRSYVAEGLRDLEDQDEEEDIMKEVVINIYCELFPLWIILAVTSVYHFMEGPAL